MLIWQVSFVERLEATEVMSGITRVQCAPRRLVEGPGPRRSTGVEFPGQQVQVLPAFAGEHTRAGVRWVHGRPADAEGSAGGASPVLT